MRAPDPASRPPEHASPGGGSSPAAQTHAQVGAQGSSILLSHEPMPPEDPDAPSVRRRGRRRFLVVCLGVLLFFLTLLAWHFLADDALQPDDDLRAVTLPAVAEHENAYPDLAEALRLALAFGVDLDRLGTAEAPTEGGIPGTLAGESSATAETTLALTADDLRRLAPAYRCLENAQQRLWLRLPERMRYDDIESGVESLRISARLLHARSRWWQREGDRARASADALGMIRLAQMQGREARGVIDLVLSKAVFAIGCAQLLAVSEQELDPALLNMNSMMLIVYEPRVDDARAALEREYQWMVKTQDALRSGVVETTDAGWSEEEAFLFRWLYKYHRSRNLLASAYRSLLRGMQPPLATAGRFRHPLPAKNLTLVMRGNPVGEYIVGSSLNYLEHVQADWYHGLAAARATSLALALRAYELTHGKLPSQVDALVSDTMPSVPLDPYDGRPVRFDATRRIVYCVGVDLIDDGGGEAAPLASGAADPAWPVPGEA